MSPEKSLLSAKSCQCTPPFMHKIKQLKCLRASQYSWLAVASILNAESYIIHHRHSLNICILKNFISKTMFDLKSEAEGWVPASIWFDYNWIRFSWAVRDPKPYFDYTIVLGQSEGFEQRSHFFFFLIEQRSHWVNIEPGFSFSLVASVPKPRPSY